MIPLVRPLYSHADREAVMVAATNLEANEEYVTRLEARLASMFGAAGAVCTTSGTAALHLALMAEGWTSDINLVIPTYTCVALLNACELAGVGVFLKDCNYEPASMNYNVSDCTHVIVDTFGVVADPLCQTVRDCAQSLGATLPPMEGSFVVSFHSSKMVSGQHGGAVVTNDHELLARLRDLNSYDAAVVADRMNPMPTYVQRVNYRMGGLCAALVLSQLDQLPAFVERRRAIADYYNDRLSECPVILPTKVPEGSVFGRYVFALQEMSPVDALRGLQERGVEGGRGVAPCLHHYLGLRGWETSNAEKAYNTVLSLPVYPALLDSEVEIVADAAKAVLSG